MGSPMTHTKSIRIHHPNDDEEAALIICYPALHTAASFARAAIMDLYNVPVVVSLRGTESGPISVNNWRANENYEYTGSNRLVAPLLMVR
jgi:hypothetical protein